MPIETTNIQPSFRALADPTRRAILTLLTNEPMTIAEISDQFDMTRGAIKKHLVVLNEGGLIAVEPRGRERVNSLKPEGFDAANSWLSAFDAFWDKRLYDLKTTIEGGHLE